MISEKNKYLIAKNSWKFGYNHTMKCRPRLVLHLVKVTRFVIFLDLCGTNQSNVIVKPIDAFLYKEKLFKPPEMKPLELVKTELDWRPLTSEKTLKITIKRTRSRIKICSLKIEYKIVLLGFFFCCPFFVASWIHEQIPKQDNTNNHWV